MSIRDEVLVLTDRFYSASDPDAVGVQSQLERCLVIVLIAHFVTAVAFWKGSELEKSIPHVIRDINVAFEINFAPDEPEPEVVPRSIPLLNPEVESPKAKKDLLIKPPVHAPTKPDVGRRPAPSVPKILDKPSLPTPGAPGPTTTGSAVKDGKTSTGTGEAGGGKGGVGTGVGNEGIVAIVPPPIPKPPPEREWRSIKLYRDDLLIRLARNWSPGAGNYDVVVLLMIDKSGKLISSTIEHSSGHKKFDRLALRAVEDTEFAPLPDWYRGADLSFRIALSSATGITVSR